MSQWLFHITPLADWQQARRAGLYRPASLEHEGFIHCSSSQDQLAGVLERFFAGQRDLLLLRIDAARVAAPVRYEAADDDVFPHVYGPLNLDAVVEVSPLDVASR
jgi:glutathione S-transferase